MFENQEQDGRYMGNSRDAKIETVSPRKFKVWYPGIQELLEWIRAVILTVHTPVSERGQSFKRRCQRAQGG